MAPSVEIISDQLLLGEGPHWDAKKQCLYFVDIFKQNIFRYTPADGKVTKAAIDGGAVTLIVPIEGSADKFVVSIGRKLAAITWNGENSTISQIEYLTEVESAKDVMNNRFNDGKADPSGRLWAGTMGFESPLGDIEMNKGSLYTLLSNNQMKPHLDKISIANGLAWNSSKDKFYYIDSPTRCVDVFDYDDTTASIANKKILFDFDKFGIPGLPDGMTIDTDDNLWVAVFNGSRILHVNGKTGELIKTVELPAKQITSVAFGGPNLDILYVTSASMTIKGEAQNYPAGCLFKVTGTGARGCQGVNVKI